jgi:hypothetical protein
MKKMRAALRLADSAGPPSTHPPCPRGEILPTGFFKTQTIGLVLLLASPLFAGPPSDTLLPTNTKGYVSIARPAEFKERWLRTQWGQMLNDEVMQPFVEDLRKQLQEEYRAVEEKLGIAWDDLEGVSGGEMSLSIIERKGETAALAITIDVTERAQQADGLLGAVEKRFAARGGRKQTANAVGTILHVFTVPTQAGSPPQTTVYFIRDNLLCGVDDRNLANDMLGRFGGRANDNLTNVVAYKTTMERCGREAGDLKPEARWFVEPFGCIYAARTLQKDSSPRGQDYAKILETTGFDAIKGVGGFVNQLVVEGEIEFVHRTSIYAPPVNPGDPLRWTKSMRMLQLPNVAGFEPQSWMPRMLAGYRTFQIDSKAAFENIGPLFDAIKEHEDAWINSLEGWKTDPYGPMVDVETEIVAHLGQRVALMTDYTLPIDEDCERSLIAVEAKNEKALAASIAKWMGREPDVVRRDLGEYVVWERVPPDQKVEELQVEVPGFESLGDNNDEKDAANKEADRERVLPNSAVTVALGHLMIVSDIEYLKQILAGFGQQDRLASSADYQQVVGVLDEFGPGERSALTFGRSDEELRPIFELVRQNKMPEAKTMFGKLLNEMLTTEQEREEGIVRKQQIDGSSLPSFEAVRRYFGPHGGVLRSEKDGWMLTGIVLNKEAP